MNRLPRILPDSCERHLLMVASVRIGLSGVALAAPIGLAWLAGVATAPALWTWGLVLLGLSLCSLFIARLMQAAGNDRLRLAQAERFYAAKCLIAGQCWGALPLLAQRPVPDGYLLALVIILLTSATMAGLLMALFRHAYLCFLLPMMLPLAWRLASEGSAMRLSAWGILAATLVLALSHRALHRRAVALIELRERSEATNREQALILDAVAEGVLLVREGRVVKCNRRAAELFACPYDSFIGSMLGALHENPGEWAERDTALQQRPDGSLDYTACLLRRDGRRFWAELSARALQPGDLARGVVWLVSDISERLYAESQLRASERRFRHLAALSSDWYWEQDAEFRYTQLNGAHLDALLTPSHHALGRRRWELPGIAGVSEEQWSAHRTQLDAHEPFADFVYQMPSRAGELRWVSSSGHPMFDEHGRFCGYHGVGTDITERMDNAARFRHLAHHDTLTGLPNRRLLDDRLEQAIAQARRWGQRVVVMLLDLDDFKLINDSAGHAAGDRALRTVAERLRRTVRESDTIARLGGDEFVVVLNEADERLDTCPVADKIIDAVREPVFVDGCEYRLGVSIGIAMYPDHGDTPVQLLALADKAMYRSKSEGGASVQIAPVPDGQQLPLNFPTEPGKRHLDA
ncbi:diguanylate cyclase domain-containing protein [Uliginosibacterium sp. H1]|uniref:diguanylate cyclase domain-containing protein n=1 Tax=Uliginosibacterium sp. H1 TaxID=3114757 RepID=UPI002E183185|nr:diguanylate cyclase [Uliginosibacterium sp. H1]